MAVQVARCGMNALATNLIFYLGESPRRAPSFVFRKITRTLAAIACGDAEHLTLGNTRVVRDFCHARDLARAATMLALGHEPGDYVCASGEGHSILDVAHVACALAGCAGQPASTPPTRRSGSIRISYARTTFARSLETRRSYARSGGILRSTSGSSSKRCLHTISQRTGRNEAKTEALTRNWPRKLKGCDAH